MSKATMNCTHCGVSFQYRPNQSNGRPRMYCSRKCADASGHVRRAQRGSVNTCAYCERVFSAQWKSTKYCCDECRWKAARLKDQERRRALRAKKAAQSTPVDPLHYGCEMCEAVSYVHSPPIVLPYDRVCRACMECLVEGMAAEAVW